MKLRRIGVFILLWLIPAMALAGAAGGTQPMIERAVVSFARDGERDAQALAELTSADGYTVDNRRELLAYAAALVKANP